MEQKVKKVSSNEVKGTLLLNKSSINTVCPRNSDLFYVVNYYIKWFTTS